MPQASVAPRAGARAAVIIARRCAASVTRSSAGSGRWSSGGCPVAVVMATLTMQIRGTGRESIQCTNLAPALRHGACLGRACRNRGGRGSGRPTPPARYQARNASCVHSIPFDDRCLISKHHGRQKRAAPGFVSRSPYHEGVRSLRYKLRSTLARHKKRMRGPRRSLSAVFRVCPAPPGPGSDPGSLRDPHVR